MRPALAILIVVALASPAAAEPTPLKWPSHRQIADWTSTGLVVGAAAAESWRSWQADDRKGAFVNQGCRLGVTIAAAEITKRVVHRTRPDGSDRMSFYSEHTAIPASMSTGWRWQVAVPVVAGVGYLRMAAAKHYATDVLTGAAAGFLSHVVCR